MQVVITRIRPQAVDISAATMATDRMVLITGWNSFTYSITALSATLRDGLIARMYRPPNITSRQQKEAKIQVQIILDMSFGFFNAMILFSSWGWPANANSMNITPKMVA